MYPVLTFFLSAFLLQSGGPKSVWDGVYSPAQSARGEAEYGDACARCHRDDLTGYNGVLLGGRFMDRWRESTLDRFFRNVQKTMPRDAPGSLSDAAYLDIVAFVLRTNRFPAGAADLTLATLPDIRVQSKEGPEPVPDFALVEVAGCMSQSAGGAWRVTGATEPARTENPGASTAADLAAFKGKAPGAHTFRLLDIDSVPEKPIASRFVLAKGFLIRQPNDDRLNLTSLQTISAPCP
ncbi:MAG: cytochrome c [Acidobacteriota bacterium]|nr:cytochrome c [Acidobacteriota bacterium]